MEEIANNVNMNEIVEGKNKNHGDNMDSIDSGGVTSAIVMMIKKRSFTSKICK